MTVRSSTERRVLRSDCIDGRKATATCAVDANDDVPLADSTVWKLCDSLMFETLGAPRQTSGRSWRRDVSRNVVRDGRVPQVDSPPVSDSTMSEGRRQLKCMLAVSGQAYRGGCRDSSQRPPDAVRALLLLFKFTSLTFSVTLCALVSRR